MRICIFSILIIGMVFPIYSNQASSYGGQETREIKALSQSEIEGYLEGNGMGFAKAAELNHFPGPKHVLELSDQLALTPEQKEKTEDNFELMKEEAVSLGRELIDSETELDRLFSNEGIINNRLESRLAEIGKLQAKLRFVHLNAHLKQKEILTPHQVMLYDELRGYKSGPSPQGEHTHTHEL